MDEENKELLKQLKALNESIDSLTKVTAISVGKEAIFKGKKETGDKVDALDEFDLPDRIIAMLVGSTEGSVASLRSQKKAKARKTVQTAPKQEEARQK